MKTTNDEVKKAAKLIEDIVKEHKDKIYERVCNAS